MSNLSKKTRDFIRQVVSPYNTRPLGVLKVTDPADTGNYSIVISATTVSLSNGTDSFSVSYIGKTTTQLATELGVSQFPVTVSAIADVAHLKSGELIGSGAIIPASFDIRDRSSDGIGAIIRVKRWAVNYKKLTSIGIRPPYGTGSMLPWWGRVEAGEFWQSIQGIQYKFSVPEYSQQAWSTRYGRPFRDVEGEQVKFIGKNKIQLARRPVVWKNNIVIAAGNSDRVYSTSVIKDVDTINGIVYIQPSTNLPEDAIVSYTYLEDTYSYKDINLNGHFLQNPHILDKYVLMYARPTESSNGIHRSRGIFHQIGESLEDAIHSIEETTLGEPVVLLGAFNVRSSSDIRDTTVTDTRSYGGGLKEDAVGQRAQDKFPHSQYFLDIGREEGIPYPGAASVVIELPAELKEVLTVDELQERAKKFLSAGVYPVFKYPEEQYEEQFVPIEAYNRDISLFSTNIEAAYSGAATGKYGGVTEASYWWDTDASLPAPLEQTIASGWDASDITAGARINTGQLTPYMTLDAGRSYYQKYLKGSPDAIFSWEERPYKGEWKRQTSRDTRTVAKDHLIGGQLHIDATLGYKEVRNLKAISPMPKPDNELWMRFGTASSKILKQITDLSAANYAMRTGLITDVVSVKQEARVRILPGEVAVDYEPFVDHYSTFTGINFWSGIETLSGIAKYAYDSTTEQGLSTGSFPYIWDIDTDTFSGQHNDVYDAVRDLHMFARTTTKLMDDYSIGAAANTPSIYYVDPYITGPGDLSAHRAQSGTYQLYKSITTGNLTGVAGTFDSDVISPFFIPVAVQQVPLSMGANSGDIYDNDDHLYAKSTRAFAALYATQVAPISGYSTGGSALHTPITEDFKSLALSGIGHRLGAFSGHLEPYYTGAALSSTWMNQYDRISQYAGNILSDVADSFDYLLYGNKEWAGALNTGQKLKPYYHDSGNHDENYRYDQDFYTGIITRVADSVQTLKKNYLAQLIGQYDTIVTSISEDVLTMSRRGGLMPPDHGKLVKAIGWLPTHALKGEAFFNSSYGYLETVFDEAAQSYVKSIVSNEGKISQQGGFAWEPAPFSGEMPSQVFEVCSRAIEIAQLKSDPTGEYKWLAVAGGLLANTTGQYSFDGGYPNDTIFSKIDDVPGDPGAIPLHGYLTMLGRKSDEFTPAEFTSITGSI